MNNQNLKRILLFGLIALILLFASIFFKGLKNSQSATAFQAAVVTNNPVSPNVAVDLARRTTPLEQSDSGRETNKTPSRGIDLQAIWNAPISFYGKVVDQNGKPIGGVNVKYVRQTMDETPEGETQSDGQGSFTISGVKGKRLIIHLTKQGFYASKSDNTSFEYGDRTDKNFHVPIAGKPVIFVLREAGHPEALVHRYLKVAVPKDGKPVSIELSSGKISENGELQIQTWKSKKDDATGRTDWRVKLTMRQGGIVETLEEFPFEAPGAGYLPQWEIEFTRQLSSTWKASIEKQFYFYCGNPEKYGRLSLSTTDLGDGCYIHCWVNPSGSRNLEYDPKVQPKTAESE